MSSAADSRSDEDWPGAWSRSTDTPVGVGTTGGETRAGIEGSDGARVKEVKTLAA